MDHVTPIRWLVFLSVVACAGAFLIVSWWAQPRPRLARTLRELHHPRPQHQGLRHPGQQHSFGSGPLRAEELFQDYVVQPLVTRTPIMVSDEDLKLLNRSPQQQVAMMVVVALAVGLSPGVLVGIAQIFGLVDLAVYVPMALVVLGMVIGPLAVHRRSLERAGHIRTDLRYQLSAFLDVVTMLLAGNTGHEGALSRAAQAGDGRLFRELSTAMREATAAGRSLISGLEQTGTLLGLVELRQVASTVSLSAAEGSPVARTLAAKCATLRSTLASEQETEARLRTSRLTTPLVGMGLIFMALVIYPALQI